MRPLCWVIAALVAASVMSNVQALPMGAPPFPGLGFLKRTYDPTTNQFKGMASPMNTENFTLMEVTPEHPNIRYLLPASCEISYNEETKLANKSNAFESASHYYHEIVSTHTHHSFFHSKTKTTVQIFERDYVQNETFSVIAQERILYTLSTDEVPFNMSRTPELDAALNRLPQNYSRDNTTIEHKKYMDFFRSFGTKVVTDVSMGGFAQFMSYYHKCLVTTFSSSFVTEESSWDVAGIISQDSGRSRGHSEYDEYWFENHQTEVELQGGDSNVYTVHQFHDWAPTLYRSPALVEFTTHNISELIHPFEYNLTSIRDNLEVAVEDYYSGQLQYFQDYVRQLFPEPSTQPPSWCTK